MIKINNNKLILNSLGILTILALGLMTFLPINAQGNTITNYGGYAGNAGYSLSGGINGTTYDSSYYNNGTNYNYNNNTYCNPIPVIYTVSPNSVNAVNGNIAVVLTGANFTVNSLTEFNNTYRPTTFMNSTRLTMILNASDLTTNGIYTILVFNPQPCGGTSNGIYFRVDNTIINPPTVTPPVVAKTVSTTTTKKITPKVATVKKTVAVAPANTQVACAPTTSGTNNQNLSANALFGANGFMPSNLIQWLVFGILILLAVVLWRKVYVTEKDKSKPLKHP